MSKRISGSDRIWPCRTAGSTLTSHSSKRFGPRALDAARQIVSLCGFVPPEDPERIEALAATFDGPALATSSNKALQARLEQNTADGPIQAPVVIAQGLSDIVVPSRATDAYVEERCSAGQRLEYWTFAGRDHGTIVQPGTPLEELLYQVDDGALRE